MSTFNHQPTSPDCKNKNLTKIIVPALLISKTLLNQSGANFPSELPDNENDWQTVQTPPSHLKRVNSP